MSDTPTVLVCDDEAAICCVVSARLRAAGLIVIEASDGAEGLDVARSNELDLVISDLQMPRMNGLELCRALKSEPRTQDLRAVLLTARGHLVRTEDLSSTNIVKLVSKPFSARELAELVLSLLRDRDTSADSSTPTAQSTAASTKRAA